MKMRYQNHNKNNLNIVTISVIVLLLQFIKLFTLFRVIFSIGNIIE